MALGQQHPTAGAPAHERRLRQMTFRLAPDLIARLDEFATLLTSRAPGMTYSRSDAVRVLLESGLEDAGLGSGV